MNKKILFSSVCLVMSVTFFIGFKPASADNGSIELITPLTGSTYYIGDTIQINWITTGNVGLNGPLEIWIYGVVEGVELSGNFTILPLIIIKSPNGGEVWQKGTTHDITWSLHSMNGKNVVILLSQKDQVSDMPTIIATVSADTESYRWTIPSNIASQKDSYGILIIEESSYNSMLNAENFIDALNSIFDSIFDYSDDYFSITDGAIMADSDNSPTYDLNAPAHITPQKYPDLFIAGVGMGIYIGSSGNYIYGSDQNDPSIIKSTTESYSTYYDHCANMVQLNEAFVQSDGRLSGIGISAPSGYICDKGRFIQSALVFPYPNGTIVKTTSSDKIYLIENNRKRWIMNVEAFFAYGLKPNSEITISHADLNKYPNNPNITISSVNINTIPEGGLIRAINTDDVYIVKYVGTKKFKRLILNPEVFNSYDHLKWSDVKNVDALTFDSFMTSSLVRATSDTAIYKLYPNGDTGQKRWIKTMGAFNRLGYDLDSVYRINQTDRNSYNTGAAIE